MQYIVQYPKGTYLTLWRMWMSCPPILGQLRGFELLHTKVTKLSI